jgi:hypothetical protein
MSSIEGAAGAGAPVAGSITGSTGAEAIAASASICSAAAFT